MRHTIKSLILDESGAIAIECGTIAALITVVIIGSLRSVGSSLSSKFSALAGDLNQHAVDRCAAAVLLRRTARLRWQSTQRLGRAKPAPWSRERACCDCDDEAALRAPGRCCPIAVRDSRSRRGRQPAAA
ncbi:Flp family type IVb pilin [Methylobacterium sp. CM6257]